MNGPMKSTYHRFNGPILDNKSIIIIKTTSASHPQPHTGLGAYHRHKSLQPLESSGNHTHQDHDIHMCTQRIFPANEMKRLKHQSNLVLHS